MTSPATSLTEEYIVKEQKHGANNYQPLPVVLARGEGSRVWDVDNKVYFDFLSAYSAVNQGHCHPRILEAFIKQSQILTLTSRAFYNDALGDFADYITQLFGYDRVLPMNSGAEGVETAMKISRKWGYEVKKIEADKAKIIFCSDNFHGRTISVISASTGNKTRKSFGPFTPGIVVIPYNDLGELSEAVADPNVAAFIVEPIQGEAGVIIPSEDYLSEAFKLCKKHNVLFVADEIQTGMCRTGKLLASDYSSIKPDMVILGKALSGGMMPISVVLADNSVMNVVTPGVHGSTFGGNPLACRTAIAALEVLSEEKLADNALIQGNYLQERLIEANLPILKVVRGRGLLCAIDIDDKFGQSGWDVCLKLMKNGLLSSPTHDNTIRLAPPLVISRKEMDEAIDIIIKTLKEI